MTSAKAPAKTTKKASKSATPAGKKKAASENNAADPAPEKPVRRAPGARPRSARELDVIRHSRELMLVPKLFALGSEDRVLSETILLPQENGTLSFRYDALGAFDLMMLCSIMALTNGIARGEPPVAFSAGDNTPEGKRVWDSLGEKARPAGQHAVLIVTSRRQLAELASAKAKGHSAEDLDRAMKSLQRLGRAQIHYRSNDRKREFVTNLIGGYSREDDKVGIVVNPRLVSAVMERVQGKWSLISMHSLRAMRSDVAKILYHRLCATIDEGCSLRINEDTLISYVWRNASRDGAETRERRKYLLKAFALMEGLDPAWKIVAHEADTAVRRAYTITRPYHPAARGQLDFTGEAKQQELNLEVVGANTSDLEAP